MFLSHRRRHPGTEPLGVVGPGLASAAAACHRPLRGHGTLGRRVLTRPADRPLAPFTTRWHACADARSARQRRCGVDPGPPSRRACPRWPPISADRAEGLSPSTIRFPTLASRGPSLRGGVPCMNWAVSSSPTDLASPSYIPRRRSNTVAGSTPCRSAALLGRATRPSHNPSIRCPRSSTISSPSSACRTSRPDLP
jgi:hypothetical protein